MSVVLKIEQLAAASDSVMIAIGTDMTPTEFLRCGDSTWIAPCPCCASGVIETDSPDYAAALCMNCEDRLDSEAAGDLPAPKASIPIPAPERPSSIVYSTGKLPSAKLIITQPVHIPKPTPVCTRCGRFMAPSMDGLVTKVCGTCKSEGKPAVERHCRECGCDMAGYHEHREYCPECQRARNITGQRRQTASSRAKATNAAVKVEQKSCTTCGADLGVVPKQTRYCQPCNTEIRNRKRRESMARLRERQKESETEGETTHE